HFIYTHSTDNQKLYVNLFAASALNSDRFALTQQTRFPYEPKTTLTINKGGTFTLALRHPAWTTAAFAVTVNGTPADLSAVHEGRASYVCINRKWAAGDVVEVSLPMQLRVEPCPNYPDYIAFKYGPILLAAQTTAASEAEASTTGLTYDRLDNEYAGEGRMDHAPGARTRALSLSSAPLLIGNRADVLERITPTAQPLHFNLAVNRGKWQTLPLLPFYAIHHARYTCYFYQQTEDAYQQSDMGRLDALNARLDARTIDFVATGEQQSEAGHLGKYSPDSNKGNFNGEFYRDAQAGGWFEYTLETHGQTDSLAILLRFTTRDKGRVATAYLNGQQLCDINVPQHHSNAERNGFYNEEIPIPAALLADADGKPLRQLTFRFQATGTTPLPGLYYLRLLKQ
ncbi:MAG: glycoside hydrolase family 127 protein, partial [Bacteroidales bacterium]|nr:glycoside hydrolase family 127 protein [Bacteroidales bacterium]